VRKENTKKRTTIYLYDDIIQYVKKNKINLSEWLNKEFREQYLSINSKRKELESCLHKISILKKEISIIKQRKESLFMNITEAEKREIATIMPRLRKGFSFDAIRKGFNQNHNRSFSVDELRYLVNLYEDQSQKRLEIALSKKHKKH